MTRLSRFSLALLSPALLSLALLALMPGAPNAQTVQIRPTAEHPDPHQIFLDQTKMDIRIESGVARITLDQTFANPNTWAAEGTYLFPLPEGAAVTDFELYMDDKPVQGEVLDRKEARQVYLGIVRRLRDPALLEYADNRLFRARIFPFEPKKTRRITLKFAQILGTEGDYRVYRYRPGVTSGSTVSGWGGLRESRSLVGLAEDQRSSGFVVMGSVAGAEGIGRVYSPTHPLDLIHQPDGSVRFSAEGWYAAVQAFDLYYEPSVVTDAPAGISMLTHRPEGEAGYWLLTISAGRQSVEHREARDLVLILDVSGSMSGHKLEQAIAALDSGLATLGPMDRFALVTFSTQAWLRTEGIETATPENVRAARTRIQDLEARGSTNLEQALDVAGKLLEDRVWERARGNETDRPTYVVVLTDGQPNTGISDADELIELTDRFLPSGTRVFTWGVGWDVNTRLLDGMARRLRGLSAYVRPEQRIDEVVGPFLARISHPLAIDLQLEADPASFHDIYPIELPDLYKGESITLLGRYTGAGPRALRLTGNTRQGPFTVTKGVELEEVVEDAEFLAPLWAQRKVGYLLEQVRLVGENTEIVDEITDLGKRHGIVTPYTSYLVTEPVFTDAQARVVPAAPAQPVWVGRPLVRLPAGSGTIRGRVRDEATGDPLAAVNLLVLTTDDNPTQMGAMTNAQGEFVIQNVPAGIYNLHATMMGYEQLVYEDQRVAEGAFSTRDFALRQAVLNVSETVTVGANRGMIQRDVTGTQQSYTIEEMERMAISSTTDILTLQTNAMNLAGFNPYRRDPNQPAAPRYLDRQLHDIHMRGGKNAEVAFMMDGLQVSNLVGGGGAGSGRAAVMRSMAERELQQTDSVLFAAGTLRRIGTREFTYDLARETWRDTSIPPRPEQVGMAAWDAGFEEIETTSEAFLMLIDEEPDLLKAAALGRKVEVKVGEKRIRLLTPERPEGSSGHGARMR